MAIFKPGALATDISGSIGGMTFSHNKGGMYVRNRSIPTNPQSEAQLNIRQILAELSAQWRSLSTRSAWRAWATQNPVMNALGAQINLSGHQAFIQINHRLRQASDTVITAPPVAVAPTALLTLSAVASVATQACTLTYTATPLGANDRLWVLGCVVDSAGIQHVSNYLRFLTASSKAQATGLNVGGNLVAVFGALTLNQIVHLRCSVFDSTTGLLSAPRVCSAVVGA